LLEEGAKLLGNPDVARHIVVSGSTPDGLRLLAEKEQINVIAFGSEYRTPQGHVSAGTSAQRLLEGGPIAIALAPAGLWDRGGLTVTTVAAVSENGDPAPTETATSLASAPRCDGRAACRQRLGNRRRRLASGNGGRSRHAQRGGCLPDRDDPLSRAGAAARDSDPIRVRAAVVKVLIAEDETIIRLDLCGLLEKHGFEVEEARDGDEAVRIAREVEPDLALLDLRCRCWTGSRPLGGSTPSGRSRS
jgi:Response regulator containing CheY-like receiver domain and AraC-type DNA-binding domain